MQRDSPGPLPIAAGGAEGAKLVARFLSEPRSTIISLSRNAWSAFRSSHFVTLAALGATICVRNGNRWIYTAKIIRIYDKQPSTAFAVKGHFKLESGTYLLSRAVTSQVPSAFRSLTSVFGMGTGGSS